MNKNKPHKTRKPSKKTCVKTCPCGISFTPKNPFARSAKYCSDECRGKKAALYYHQVVKKDPEKYKKHYNRAKENGRVTREWLYNYKITKGCVDCGYNVHFAALHLDHTGKKTEEIQYARSSISRLKAEIENGKCEVRCANCHSVKTWADKNKLEYIPEMANNKEYWNGPISEISLNYEI